jgi:cell division control protein 45
MYLTIDQWNLGYNQILKDCRSGSGDVGCILILCAMDADAMCTARIVTYCLRADGIPYQLRPCGSYESLTKSLGCMIDDDSRGGSSNPQEEDAENDDIRAVLLINLGSMKNLSNVISTSTIFSSPENEAKLYVLDCHRPIHLANIYAGKQVVVFVDELDADDLPGDGDGLSGDEEEEEEEDEESENHEDDNDEGEHEFQDDDDNDEVMTDKEEDNRSSSMEKDDSSIATKSQDDDVATQGSEGEEERPMERSDGDNESVRQEVEEVGRETLEELVEQRRRAIAMYYNAGAYWGAPSSWVAYTIATKGLRFGNVSDLLWLACVGVTDAYIHRRLDMGGYAVFSQDLAESVQRLYPNDSVISRAMNAFSSTFDSTLISASEAGKIIRQQEYKFMLLRHWNLYDSMYYSTHVATKLQVYSPEGKLRLRELLAKMGFPLEECQQPFSFMRPALKARLKDSLELHAEVSALVVD